MFAAALRSIQPASRWNIRNALLDLTKPSVVQAVRLQSTWPSSSGSNYLQPGNFAEETRLAPLNPEAEWTSREDTAVSKLYAAPNKYQGRTVSVESSLGKAFDRLSSLMKQNNVFREVRMQERHEKKGYKRRRLESERWRRRFAHEVRRKVQLVNEIRARGA